MRTFHSIAGIASSVFVCTTEEKVSATINFDEDNKEQDIRRQVAKDQPKNVKSRTKKVKNESKKQKKFVSSLAKENPSVDPILMAV